VRTNFDYRWAGLSRFSMPVVELYFDGKKWLYPRAPSGRQRLNPLPGEHAFRAYLRYPAKTMKLQITFPGTFNLGPEKIEVKEIFWANFAIDNYSARDIGYKLEP
jgi:hypothetical protein